MKEATEKTYAINPISKALNKKPFSEKISISVNAPFYCQFEKSSIKSNKIQPNALLLFGQTKSSEKKVRL